MRAILIVTSGPPHTTGAEQPAEAIVRWETRDRFCSNYDRIFGSEIAEWSRQRGALEAGVPANEGETRMMLHLKPCIDLRNYDFANEPLVAICFAS